MIFFTPLFSIRLNSRLHAYITIIGITAAPYNYPAMYQQVKAMIDKQENVKYIDCYKTTILEFYCKALTD